MPEQDDLVFPHGKVIGLTDVPSGRQVSTVLLPEHQRRSLPYETMVFASATNSRDLDCERYATQAEAEVGHTAIVARWWDGDPCDPPLALPDGFSEADLTELQEQS